MNSDFLIVSIEDDLSVAKGLVLTLESTGYKVLHFAEGDSFLEALPRIDPSLLLLDIRLPGKDGFQICREIRSMGFRFPVIMLTARDDDLDKINGLEDGADDYIVKPYSRGELLSRIHARLRRSYGTLAEQQEDFSFGPFRLSRDGMYLKKNGEDIILTPIEYKLLLFFLKHQGQCFQRSELLNRVWSSDNTHYGDERTVDVHVRHLRTKIEENPSQPVYLSTIRGVGYCFSSES